MSGFRLVTRENVFRVCDQPHPLLVAQIVDACTGAHLYKAYEGMKVRPAPGFGAGFGTSLGM